MNDVKQRCEKLLIQEGIDINSEIDFDVNGKIGDVMDSYTVFENNTETIYTTAFILHKDPDFRKWMFKENL